MKSRISENRKFRKIENFGKSRIPKIENFENREFWKIDNFGISRISNNREFREIDNFEISRISDCQEFREIENFDQSRNSRHREFREFENFQESWISKNLFFRKMYFSEKSRILKIVNFEGNCSFSELERKVLKPLSFFTVKFWWFNHNSRKCYSCLFVNEKFKNPYSRKWTWSPNFDQTKIFQKPNSAIWNFAEKSGPEIWKSSKGMNEDNEWSVNERKSQGPVIFKSRISLWTTNYLKKLKFLKFFQSENSGPSRAILNWPKWRVHPPATPWHPSFLVSFLKIFGNLAF